MNAPLLASIGTTHPWNIAGTGLDARVAAEYGIGHVMAIAAVSAQDERGVRAVQPVPHEVVQAQLECLPAPLAAIRIGALVSTQNVRAVAAYLRTRAASVPAVVDPVMAASLGGELRSDSGLVPALHDELLTLPVIVTPNLDEAETLLGERPASVDDCIAAGRRFVAAGARAAYLKGGHLPGDPVDVLVTADTVEVFHGERLPGSMRGGGCVLAAALACELALGRDIVTAAGAARGFVRERIAARAMRGGLQVAF